MRKLIIFFITILVLTSCDSRPIIYNNLDSKATTNYRNIVESIEIIDSKNAMYLIVNCYKTNTNENVKGGRFYYVDTIGKFNVGDKIQFVKE